METPLSPKNLIDGHGRQIRKLRLSVTDQCNLRCQYCMPIDARFMDSSRLLSASEYFEIVAELCSFGVAELRLTGGEPLMRRDIAAIVAKLSSLPLRKIGLTTNGLLLARHFDHLHEHRVKYLNISIDSLSSKTFHSITNGGVLRFLLANVEKAQALGFAVKLNVVVMRGINDHEVCDFVEFSKHTGLEVRFLELMRIGYACANQTAQFVPAHEILQKLRERYIVTPIPMAIDSTSFNFTTSCGAKIGFIASESKAFCGHCSRWRLSADGILRACLLKDAGLSLRHKTAAERQAIYSQVLGMKPAMRPAEVAHSMNMIGG